MTKSEARDLIRRYYRAIKDARRTAHYLAMVEVYCAARLLTSPEWVGVWTFPSMYSTSHGLDLPDVTQEEAVSMLVEYQDAVTWFDGCGGSPDPVFKVGAAFFPKLRGPFRP